MASITINQVPNLGTSSSTITGDEKFVIINSSGKPGTVGVNLILNRVDDRVDDAIDEQLDTIIEEKIDDKIDDALDDIGNLNWNDVS